MPTIEQRALLDFVARHLEGQPAVTPLITIVGDGEGKIGLLLSRKWLDFRFPPGPERERLVDDIIAQARHLLTLGEESHEPTDP